MTQELAECNETDLAAALVATRRLLEEDRAALRQLVALARLANTMIAVGANRQEVRLDDWLPGVPRVIAPDRSHGSDGLALVNGVALLVADREPGRIGGEIVNISANSIPVNLYLSGAQELGVTTAGRAAMQLAAGASWDFRLGNAVWCGPIAAIAKGGSGLLTVAIV